MARRALVAVKRAAQAVSDHLRAAGWATDRGRAADVRRRLADQAYDLLIVDLDDGVDTVALVAAARRQSPALKVVLLAATLSVEAATRLTRDLPGAPVLRAPATARLLAQAVAAA